MNREELAKEYLVSGEETAGQALRSLQFAQQLRAKRLESLGLECGSTFELRDEAGQNFKPREDGVYREELFGHRGVVNEVYAKDGKKIYDRKKPAIMYTTVIDLKDPDAGMHEDDLYCCPNCGSVTKIGELLSGCPYCGTKFVLSELYPRVENSYCVYDVAGTPDEVKQEVRKFQLWGAGIACLFGLLVAATEGGITLLAVFSLAICMLLGGFMGYLVWAVRKLFVMFREAGKALPLLSGLKSPKKYDEVMAAYPGTYTYEHFAGNIVSLLKILIFSDSDTDLPFYKGAKNSIFSDVVNSSFRGSAEIQDIGIADGICTANVKVFLENLHYRNGKLNQSRDKVVLTVKKDMRGDAIKPFSVHAIRCRGCGGSFDAYQNRTCPYCGREYDLEDLDWVVTDMREI